MKLSSKIVLFLTVALAALEVSTARSSSSTLRGLEADVQNDPEFDEDLFEETGGECCLFDEQDNPPGGSRLLVQANRFHVLFYGSEVGYQNNRAQVTLYNGSTVLAYLRFKDPGMPWIDDYTSSGIIRMHMPTSSLHDVLDMIKDASYINVYWSSYASRGFLSVSP